MTDRIATIEFSSELQVVFAEMSGDFNPIHVDRVVARRLLYGDRIVHGVHTVLATIEALLAESTIPTSPFARIESIECSFEGPMFCDDRVTVTLLNQDEIGAVAPQLAGNRA